MKLFNENQISNLSLIKTDINKRTYELRANDESYASFEFNEENSICEIATARSKYLIQKGGIWQPFIQMKSDSSNPNIRINITPSMASTILDGYCLHFKNINFWKNHWAWVNANNHSLIKYNPIIAGSTKAEIFISDDFKHNLNLETICCIGCYLLIAFDIDEELNLNK